MTQILLYDMFLKLKVLLKGMQFDSIEDIQANTEKCNTLKEENIWEFFQKW